MTSTIGGCERVPATHAEREAMGAIIDKLGQLQMRGDRVAKEALERSGLNRYPDAKIAYDPNLGQFIVTYEVPQVPNIQPVGNPPAV